ncbi:MAG: ribosomal RNA small subunit methyltransferase A [Candidatus Micrarchaeota archaeon]|nr:ribosomal RNA small subunit methyltransferase A [Candidatus Micrarchaeota archaeon]
MTGTGFSFRDLRRRRYKGQHFLTDDSVLKREVEYARVSKKDIVLEIGAGPGNLTEHLSRAAGKVIAVESDDYYVSLLRSKELKNVEIIHGDVMKVELPEFNKVVSNIPYYLSSPITFLLFRKKWDVAVLCYQKEFGERLVAKPGDKNYSRISVAASYYVRAEIMEVVPREKFFPKPKVDSVIVRMYPDRKNIEIDWDIVRKIFSHRKKTVKNALRSSGLKFSGIPENILKKRVFQCSLEEISMISGCAK